MVDPAELAKQAGKIRILTNRLIDERLSGDYHSIFKGQGVEFDEVRPYTPGDDIRSIDWNVTARTGQPFVKRFSEERELTVFFLVDISGSQSFGSGGKTKAELAAEVAGLLAMTAVRNQDKVGLALFSDRIVKYIAPRKGRAAVMRLVREVLAFGDTGGKTDIAAALRFLENVQKRRAVVFLISDFMDSGYERELRTAARHHDMVACPVRDPLEAELPDAGLQELLDPESGELVLVDTSSRKVREAFKAASLLAHEELLRFFKRTGIDCVPLNTAEAYIDGIRALFRKRARKRR